MFIVMALDPYDDFGEKQETFKHKSAAEVYGRSNFGEGNFIVVGESGVKSDGIYCDRKAS